MQGHAAANMVPLVSANRIGQEHGEAAQLTFYGSSFIADELGAKVAEADGNSRAVITATFDLDALQVKRASRSEEHTSELQSLMRISYAVFCLKKKNIQQNN